MGYSDVFEEKSVGVQCLGYVTAPDGCEVVLYIGRRLRVTEAAGWQSVYKWTILGSVHAFLS